MTMTIIMTMKALSWVVEYLRQHLLLLPESVVAGHAEERPDDCFSLLGDGRSARVRDVRRRRVSLFASGAAVALLLLLASSSSPYYGGFEDDPATAASSDRTAASFADDPLYSHEAVGPPPLGGAVDLAARARCQVIYIVGLESRYDLRRGVLSLVEALARRQTDPETGREFVVDVEPRPLRTGLFGWHRHRARRWGFPDGTMPPLGDPALVRRVVDESCPNDGRRRVYIESQAFPSGREDDPRPYRVRARRGEWANMTAEEISYDDEAMSHPTNMTAFLEAYGPHMDVKLVVLHRPFLELVAASDRALEDPRAQSNVVRGFMLILRRFLDAHAYDPVAGGRLWTLLCVDEIHSRLFDRTKDAQESRANVMARLAAFLGWSEGECRGCFDDWREVRRGRAEIMEWVGGREVLRALERDRETLRGVWPPSVEEVAEQRCQV